KPLRAPTWEPLDRAPERCVVERRAEDARHAQPRHANGGTQSGDRHQLARSGGAGAIHERREAVARENARERRGIEAGYVAPLVEGAAQGDVLTPALGADAVADDGRARAV